jgi:hypothetical protein
LSKNFFVIIGRPLVGKPCNLVTYHQQVTVLHSVHHDITRRRYNGVFVAIIEKARRRQIDYMGRPRVIPSSCHCGPIQAAAESLCFGKLKIDVRVGKQSIDWERI